MSLEQRKTALWYLMFQIEKHYGTIIARGCADRKSKKEYTTKSKTSSPTLSREAMMLFCAFDAKENRYMAVTDIPRTFLQ